VAGTTPTRRPAGHDEREDGDIERANGEQTALLQILPFRFSRRHDQIPDPTKTTITRKLMNPVISASISLLFSDPTAGQSAAQSERDRIQGARGQFARRLPDGGLRGRT
jgi:hypothetical protein